MRTRIAGRITAGRGPGIAGPALTAVGVAAAALVAMLSGRLALAGWAGTTRSGPADPAELLLTLCAAISALLAGWLALGTLAAAIGELPGLAGRCGRAVADRLAPAALRRGVAFLLGTAVLAAVAPGTAAAATAEDRRPGPTASASPGAATAPVTASTAGSATTPGGPGSPGSPEGAPTIVLAPAPDPGFHPVTTVATAVASAGPSVDAPTGTTPRPTTGPTTPTGLGPLGPAPRDPADPGRIVVRRGESLWSIAARHLGPTAGPREIAREWPRWYAANRAVIGADPDLIEPGQVLVAPAVTR